MNNSGNQIFATIDKAVENKTAQTADGFDNFAARLGVGNPQKNVISAGHYEFNLITKNRTQLEAAYRGSWIVGQVIDTVAEDMTRAGINITTSEQPERIQDLHTAMSRLQLWGSTCNTIKWGRLYGGAIGVMQIKGQNPGTPLDPETISKGQFQGITVYDRWQLNPSLSELIQSGPDMGLPMYYNIVMGNLTDQNANATGQVKVHHSRCLRNIGIELPYYQAQTESMWGESVLERLWDRLISFDTATMSSANLINRANLRTVGVDGLREILAAGGKAQEALIAQFEYMRMFQNNEGISLLDKNDTFASTAYSFAGLSDMLLQYGQQLSGAAGIPLVRLFGQSPAGLSATGDADIRMYYDNINAQQEAKLRNSFEMILKVLWRSLFGVPAPKDLEFTFTPLWQMNATDRAAIAKSNTETITSAFDKGLTDKATTLKELRQDSGDTGLFSNITDEQIEEAEQEEPPMLEAASGINGSSGVEASPQDPDSPADPAAKIKAAAGDSAWKRVKAWLSKDAGKFKESDHPRAKSGQFGKGGSSHEFSHHEEKAKQDVNEAHKSRGEAVEKHGFGSKEHKSAQRKVEKSEKASRMLQDFGHQHSALSSMKSDDPDRARYEAAATKGRAYLEKHFGSAEAGSAKKAQKTIAEFVKGTAAKTPSDVEMIPADIFEANLSEEQVAAARARFRKPDDRPNPSLRTPEEQSAVSHALEKAMRDKPSKPHELISKFVKNLGGDSSHTVTHEKLADIAKELGGKHTGGKMESWIESPDGSTAPEHVSVVRKDGKIVGWSGVGKIRMGRSWEPTLSVYVDKDARGQGLGEKLVKEAVKKAAPDSPVYFDPDAPNLGKWIEAAGHEAEPIPRKML